MQQMRLRPVRRLPAAFGWLTKRGDAATARWIKPILYDSEIRRDTVRVLRAIAAEPRLLLDTAGHLTDFDRPALIVWASEDRVMPPEARTPAGRASPERGWSKYPIAYTLLPLDQPTQFAKVVQEFVAAARSDRPA